MAQQRKVQPCLGCKANKVNTALQSANIEGGTSSIDAEGLPFTDRKKVTSAKIMFDKTSHQPNI